ncbi:uroporphyrinogen-III synthase [Piscinibacter sp. XHJ-5]|uniref:uroporphyrinogen-III synthase n=1 Tax=Piscinibacter sp. XHJ-5 TaxID=3037797 RepID=UPI0024530A98|nr:uroporphyrinogen-III synthase [Piscinibacter sp. XHJ-5]
MRVIVTRPAAQAAAWVRSLRTHGIEAVALPLIDIGPPADVGAVHAAWHSLAQHRIAVFVSPNAAESFFRHRPQGAAWPPGVLAGSVGPGTTRALRSLQVPAAAIVEPAADAAQFDSEALWQRLRDEPWRGASALIVRGDGGREWLADTLRAHGAHVSFVSAYRRAAPTFEADARRLLDAALDQPAQHLWFFSSSEAIDHLLRACPGREWGTARAVATHPRIASRARESGFGQVHETRPTLDAVVACIQSIAS